MIKLLRPLCIFVASFAIPQPLFMSPVFALPPEEVSKKLDVIAVFALEFEDDQLLFTEKNNFVAVPLYLRVADAERVMADFRKNNPGGKKVRLQYFSLGDFNKRILPLLEKRFKEIGNKKIETPVVIPAVELKRAAEILRGEGYSDQQIKEKLDVPVFFSKPMLLAQADDGSMKEMFFMSHSQMRSAVDRLPEDSQAKLKISVSTLAAVVELIEKTDEDKYAFAPTEDFMVVRKAYREKFGDEKNSDSQR